ncbi:MAG TPA: hypothetical protein VFG78_13405 [Gemmatimonadota bacterium]|nr:hypothetical protein [Gemmatimonadota bacterium]
MRAIEFGLAGLAAALIALAPPDLHAQGRGKAKGHDKHDRGGPPGQVEKQDDDDDDFRRGRVIIRGDRDDRRDRVDRRIRRDRNGQIVLRDGDGRIIVIGRGGIDERFRAHRGGGPKFCRTGAGHPVFGRRWCLEKGFGLGDRDDVFFDDGRVIFWDDDRPVVVRDRRFRRDRSLWEVVLDRILFWSD